MRLTGMAFLSETAVNEDGRFAGWTVAPGETAAFGIAIQRQIAARTIGTK